MAAPLGNRYAEGNNGGRPPMYSNAEELRERIEAYFISIWDEDNKEWSRRPMIVDLALFLGFADKMSLYEYAKKKEFTYPIKRALSMVESEYENMLESRASTGAIFALKNMRWKDKTEVEQTTKDVTNEINVNDLDDRTITELLKNLNKGKDTSGAV